MHPTMLIDGRWVSFTQGQTILEAAQAANVHIPSLCYYKESGHCDICRICVVEVEGSERLLPACSTHVKEGMEVWTNTERVAISRQRTIDMLLATGRHGCMACDANGDCRLQDLAYGHGAATAENWPPVEKFPKAFEDPFIARDYSKCILCGRCVAACMDIQVNGAIKNPFGRREEHLGCEGWFPLPDHAKCVECGQCVEACPVGALREKKARGAARTWDTDKIRTTCPHCGVGCQQLLHVKDGQIAKVTAVADASPDKGRLCVKGRFLYDFVYSGERLTSPLIKKNGRFRKASWDEALDLVASRFKDVIRRHGPDAVAGLCSAEVTNEDSYNMQKLFRSAMGTNNVDHISDGDGLAASFGYGAATNSFNEIADARMILCIGADMCYANPIAATFVKNAVRSGSELIVAGNESGPLSEHAIMNARLRAGSEVAFINGLMQVLLTDERYDNDFVRDHCEGFDEFKASVMKYTPERAAEAAGLDAELIRRIARRFASVKPAVACYIPGAAGSAGNVESSLANLQMLLGNIGDGGGVNIIRSRNNVQGVGDMGVSPGMLPGYQMVSDPGVRETFARAWRVQNLTEKPGLPASKIPDALINGSVKAFYCFGVEAQEGSPEFRKSLVSTEFIVFQGTALNEAGRVAHVVLPSAAWAECDGTFTNSERRVSRVRKAKEPPGLAMTGWWVFREIAKRMGHDWASASAVDIWDEEVSALVPIFAGIKYRRIEGDGIQWPCPSEGHPGTPVLHRDGEFARGRGLFIPCE